MDGRTGRPCADVARAIRIERSHVGVTIEGRGEGGIGCVEAREQRMKLLGNLMDTARGVMATTATSISARNRDQLQLGLKQYDEAKGAYESLTLLGQDAKDAERVAWPRSIQRKGTAQPSGELGKLEQMGSGHRNCH